MQIEQPLGRARYEPRKIHATMQINTFFTESLADMAAGMAN
jgi:hypothetical protein